MEQVIERARRIVTNQSVSYTAASAASAAFNSQTEEIIVTCTTDAYIEIGPTPTATTATSMYLPAFVPSMPLFVSQGRSWKVAAIRDSADGAMKIAEFRRN